MKMKKWIICQLLIGSFFLGVEHEAAATEAWSIDASVCTPYIYNGVLDTVSHATDTYGRYAKVGSGDTRVWLQCPVWLPQNTLIDTIKVRALMSSDNVNCYVEAHLYKQDSIWQSSFSTYTLIDSCEAVGYTSYPQVKTCSFTQEHICNYRDAFNPYCNDYSEVHTYYFLLDIRNYSNCYSKFYSVWLGDPPGAALDVDPAYPIDCGIVMERYYNGIIPYEEEKPCLMQEMVSVM